MRSEKQKLMIMFQGLWITLSLPLASLLAKALDCHDLLMLLFFYISITYPAWIGNVWNWSKNSTSEELPKKLIYSILAISIVISILLLVYLDQWGIGGDDIIAIALPILCFVVFISLNTDAPNKTLNLVKKITKIICLKKKLIVSLAVVIMMILGSMYFISRKREDDKRREYIEKSRRYREEQNREYIEAVKTAYYFTPYTQKQKKEALSIQEFISGLNGLTEIQEAQYLEKSKNIIISGYATVKDVTGTDYPNVELIWHNKYSDTWDLSRIEIKFNLQNEEALKLRKNQTVKFIGRLISYNVRYPEFKIWQVEIEK